MNAELQALLAELEEFGARHDASVAERAQRMLNITRDTGELLAVLVRALEAREVLEIGTSNGYSTLWLAEAVAAAGGRVTTVERAEHKIALARRNFARSGLGSFIDLRQAQAEFVLSATPEGSVDLLFLDADRDAYVAWWPDMRRVLRGGGLLVVDNAVSHAGELADFTVCVRAERDWSTCLVPVGNGEFLAVKHARRD